jgi:hypothetical protein
VKTRSHFLTAACIVIAAALNLWLQSWAILLRSDFGFSAFRNYFFPDQLSYLSMIVDIAHGNSTAVEPFTGTGANHYPHLYYVLLGYLARVTGISPIAAWTVGGMFMSLVLGAAIATTLVIMTRRRWAAFFGPLPLLIGTFAFVHGNEAWSTPLNSHAVIWGGFATMFTFNGETFSLTLGVCALLLMLVALTRLRRNARRLVAFAFAAVIIGLLANVQTYSFLVVLYIAAYSAAVWGIAAVRRWYWWAAASVVLVIVLFVGGPHIAADSGTLTTLVLGLVPALPGLALLIWRTRGVAVAIAVLAAAAALPQVLTTALGVAENDPFLTYRVDSTKDLGVNHWGLIGAFALLLPILGVLVAGIMRRERLWLSYAIGGTFAWALLALNDRWGANQEPYRLWLDGFVVMACTLLPVVAHVLVGLLSARGDERTVVAADAHPLVVDPAPLPAGSRSRRWVRAAAIACAVVVFASLGDYINFSAAQASTPMLHFYGTPQSLAIQQAVDKADAPEGAIFVTDPCIDPYTFKIVTGAPVAFFNEGMAWPEDYRDLREVQSQRAVGKLAVKHAIAARADLVVTDSMCAIDWAGIYQSQLRPVSRSPYSNGSKAGEISVWRLGAGQ